MTALSAASGGASILQQLLSLGRSSGVGGLFGHDADGGGGASATSAASTSSSAPPPKADDASASRFATDTLASLIAAQSGGGTSGTSRLANAFISLADADGDGGLSSNEVASAIGQSSSDPAFSAAFAKLDANGDGSLSADELSAGLKAMHHAGGRRHTAASEASSLVNAFDSDGSGGLSLNEIAGALGIGSTSSSSSTDTSTASSASGINSTQLADAFKAMDANGDGTLSASEITATLEQLMHARQGYAAQTSAYTTGAALSAAA